MTEPPTRLKVGTALLFHSTCAVASTLVAKWSLKILSLPATLLMGQTLVSLMVMVALSRITTRVSLRLVQPWKAWRALVPLAFAKVIGVLSKTFCLANVDASFYQNARGLLLPFSVLLSLFFLSSTKLSKQTLLGVGVVILGFVVGVSADLDTALTSKLGVILGVWSSFTTAVETIVLKRYMDGSSTPMIQALYTYSVISLFLYAPIVYFSSDLLVIKSATPAVLKHFVSAVTLTGSISLLLATATWLQVKITSPITHSVVTAARGVVQSGMACIVFAERLSWHRGLSTAFILAGGLVYARSKEMERQDSLLSLPKTRTSLELEDLGKE